MSSQPSERFNSFAEFYPYYLEEHRNPTCRRLHYAGSLLVLVVLGYVLLSGQWLWLLTLPVIGYGFAWVGHFAFERNRPATFQYPLYSLMGDWVMFKDMLTGRLRF
ncbi:Mpo1-like protein [Pseudomonas sp. WHRI 8822A]|uniref:Mpo1-like protein n=1 Tax=Pseudomonas sp. WHRI 8822A TaxID=3162568 RepID=UPI0032F07D40